MTEAELAWLAGLLEGEGSFSYLRRAGRPDGRPRISCIMSDRDIIERLRTVTGTGTVNDHPDSPSRLGTKPLFRWVLSAAVDVRDLCELLSPWLGERRREQCRVVIEALADIKIAPAGCCVNGHPLTVENRMGGYGSCRTCGVVYRRERARVIRQAKSCIPQ